MNWNRVETVEDYWDGPRQGYAFLDGGLVFYNCIWSEADDAYSDQFIVKPIPSYYLSAVREHWSIWRRWESAFAAGKTTKETHPALPADKERNQELQAMLSLVEESTPDGTQKVTGVFRRLSDEAKSWQVRWIE